MFYNAQTSLHGKELCQLCQGCDTLAQLLQGCFSLWGLAIHLDTLPGLSAQVPSAVQTSMLFLLFFALSLLLIHSSQLWGLSFRPWGIPLSSSFFKTIAYTLNPLSQIDGTIAVGGRTAHGVDCPFFATCLASPALENKMSIVPPIHLNYQ